MPSRQQALSLLKQFEGLRVLVVGDVMLDTYIFGKVERISPEAPVPVVAVKERTSRLGGAANVALNLHALGAEPVMVSVIGNDPRAEEFAELCIKQQLNTSGLIRVNDRPTTTKFRVIGNNVQMLRVDEESTQPVTESDTEAMLQFVAKTLKSTKIDGVVFQDYDKGVISPRLIDQVVSMAHAQNIPVAVDPKKRNFLHYKKVDFFKPNLKELREGLNINPELFELEAAVANLQFMLDAQQVMVTLSEKGVYIRAKNTNDFVVHRYPAFLRNIADVSGAGDTVISVATLCLALRQPSWVTAYLSNLAGGLVCEEVGVVPVNKTKLQQELFKILQ